MKQIFNISCLQLMQDLEVKEIKFFDSPADGKLLFLLDSVYGRLSGAVGLSLATEYRCGYAPNMENCLIEVFLHKEDLQPALIDPNSKNDVFIVARTKMNDGKVCIGAISVYGTSLRLLDANGQHETDGDCPYHVGDIWRITYAANPRKAPHTEDVNVKARTKQGETKVPLLSAFLEAHNRHVFHGPLDSVYDGMLKRNENGTLFISGQAVPNYSTCFWVSDVQLTACAVIDDKVRYADGTCSIAYVGTDEPAPVIPAGSLVRFSLAHWWVPEDKDAEERCYLQLSGWYAIEAEA